MDIFLDQTTQDLVLLDGDLKITSNRQEELMQRLFIRFKTYTREWFWDLDYGVDYINKVFGLGRSKSTVDALIKNTISLEPLVDRYENFSSKIEDYKYSCSFTVYLISEQEQQNIYLLVNEQGLTLTDGTNKLFTIF